MSDVKHENIEEIDMTMSKCADPQADMPEESAIDELVYELYGLSEEEIKIVEGEK